MAAIILIRLNSLRFHRHRRKSLTWHLIWVTILWFVMPLCLIALIGILIHTANISTEIWNEYERAYFESCEQEFDGCPEPDSSSIFFAESMISGYCGGLAFLIIGMRTLGGILNFEYDEEDDDDDYDFYGS